MQEDKLIKLIKRRHPEYDSNKTHWDFLEQTYSGGRAWFDGNIFRYIKEGNKEFKDRIQRAYRFNHSREVVNLVNKYIFKGQEISRNEADAPQELVSFWKSATRAGMNIDQFMRLADIKSSVLGRVWIFVDSTSMEARNLKEQKELGSRAYVYIVRPQDVLDVGYDDEGEMQWILLFEQARDDDDPFESSGDLIDRYRLWTKEKWYLIEDSKVEGKRSVRIIDEGENNIGEIPAIPLDNMAFSESRYWTPALINDIAYLDRAVANYLSNLDAIIQDQSFSQLAMPAQGLMPGEPGHKKLVEMGTKRIFTYDGEHGAAPFYLSPDPKQAQVILDVIAKIINEIYHSVGVAGERTKQDNSVGIDNSSGVAKAYDFERVNSLLSTKAQALQTVENEISRLVAKWSSEEIGDRNGVGLVKYPTNFDVRGLSDEFSIAEQLSLVEAPETARREQMRILIDKLMPNLAKQLRAEIEKELKEYPSKADELEIGKSPIFGAANIEETQDDETTTEEAV